MDEIFINVKLWIPPKLAISVFLSQKVKNKMSLRSENIEAKKPNFWQPLIAFFPG